MSDRIGNADEMASEVERMMQARTEPNAMANASQAADSVMENFALYHRKSAACIGSRTILNMIHPVKEDFMTVDIDTLGSQVPEWLNGTPIVVDNRQDDRPIYRGSDAVFFLKEHYGDMVKGA